MSKSRDTAITMLKAALTDAGFSPLGEAFDQLSIPMGKARYAIVEAVAAALDAPRAPMTEDEILQRARRAFQQSHPSYLGDVKTGIADDTQAVKATIAALRDLDKPLVDPVVLACREACASVEERLDSARNAKEFREGARDDDYAMRVAIAAYKAATQ